MVGRVAHRPLTDAVAAAPFGEIDMHMIFMKAVGGGSEHGGEARAGACLQPLAHWLRHSNVCEFIAFAVRQRDGTNIDRVALAMFADFPTEHAIAPAAFIGVE